MRATYVKSGLLAVVLMAIGLLVSTVGIISPASRTFNRSKIWTELPSADGSKPFVLRSDTFTGLAAKLTPAVVNINVVRKNRVPSHYRHFQRWFRHPFPGDPFFSPRPQNFEQKIQGTGLVINASGYILTNNHVVANSASIKVTLHNKSSYRAKLIGSDPKTDLALLKISPREKLQVAPLGNSDRLRIGEWVMAIGNPFGLSHTVTVGIISARGRRSVRPDERMIYANFLQTDASINPGNSGGPLINLRGEVVGINTAIHRNAQGIGFAIPINMVKSLIPDLLNGAVKRSWLGVTVQPVTEQLARSIRLGKTRGALVREVIAGGPAERAGVQPGDVILSLNSRVINSSADLPWTASRVGIGKTVPLEVFRNGRVLTLKVKMGRYPEKPWQRQRRYQPHSNDILLNRLGLNVRRDRVESNGKTVAGVVVSRVEPGSPAHYATVKAGDLIVSANGEALNSPEQLARLVQRIPANGMIRLNIRRGNRHLFIAFGLSRGPGKSRP